MIKTERNFDKLIGEVNIGQSCIVSVNGVLYKTGPVENWAESYNGDMTINTKNSIYRKRGI